jgi:hypothetical protein
MNNEENQSQELVPTTEPINSLQVVNVDSAVEFWHKYQELTEKLLDPSDYHIKGNTKFKKKSAWRKYATAFNISTEIIEKDLTRDEKGRIVTAEYTVKATLPNGRSEEGTGFCSIWDKSHEHDRYNYDNVMTCKGPCDGRPHFDKPEHDIPSTAHTRAKNRAISDLIGAGEVSAEEIDFTKGKTGGAKKVKKTPKKAVAKKKFVKKAPPKTKEPVGTVDGDFTKEDEEEVNKENLEKACKKYPLMRNIKKAFNLDGTLFTEKNIRDELIDDERCPPEKVDEIMEIING